MPGKPGPVQRSIFVPGFRITPSLSAKLESRVKRLGLSRSEYFRRLIARDVKEKSQ